MRPLLFLVLAFLLVALVLRFHSRSAVEGAEEGPPEVPSEAEVPGGAVRFLEPPAIAPPAAEASALPRPSAEAGVGPPPEAPLPRADAPEERLGRLELEARAHADAGRWSEAARAWSDLLQLGLALEVDRSRLGTWTSALGEAQSRHRWSPRGDWPSVEVEVERGDTLTAIRKRYLAAHPDRLLCTGLVERANGIRGYIQPGQTLSVPTDPVRVLVDLSSHWLLYFHGDEVALAFEVGIGRSGEETITGTFAVGEKQERPTWWPQGQEPVPFGSPENPLGTRWIGWYQDGAKTGYGIHGTWEPDSVGRDESDGCIRLRNEDVELLFEVLPLGAPVVVRE